MLRSENSSATSLLRKKDWQVAIPAHWERRVFSSYSPGEGYTERHVAWLYHPASVLKVRARVAWHAKQIANGRLKYQRFASEGGLHCMWSHLEVA